MRNNSNVIFKLFLFLCIIPFMVNNINAQVHTKNEKYFLPQNKRKIVNRRDLISFTSSDSNVTLLGRWGNGPSYAVAVKGHIAYFGNGYYLEIADVTDPHNPNSLGKIFLPSLVEKIAVNGDYVYVITEEDGLQIINVSDPANPVKAGHFDTGHYVGGIFTKDKYVFIVKASGSLLILDVNNPSSPSETGYFSANGGYSVGGVYVSGNYAYVAEGEKGLIIVDVSNPSEPVKIGSFYSQDFDVKDVFVKDNYAYLANDYEIIILDISNPTLPNKISNYGNFQNLKGIYVSGDYAYVGSDEYFLVLDISNPSAPQLKGYLETKPFVWDISVNGNYAYIAYSAGGLGIINISNSTSPIETSSIEGGDYAMDVCVSDNYAYVADRRAGLRILDISNPNNPSQVGFSFTDDEAHGIHVSGNYAYIADTYHGLKIFDISNPMSPFEVGTLNTGYSDSQSAELVFVKDNYAYISDEYNGFIIADVSNPSSPSIIWSSGSVNPTGIFVKENYAYLSQESGLSIWDVSNPSETFKVSSLNLNSLYSGGVYVSGNYAYLANSGLYIVDISSPASPIKIDFIPDGAMDVFVKGKYAYVTEENEMQILDVSNPTSPNVVGVFNLNSSMSNIFVSENKIYVASGTAGVYILQNDLISKVKKANKCLPMNFNLSQNYPNPFPAFGETSAPTTKIKYSIPVVGSPHMRDELSVHLTVYDILGREIATLVNKKQPPGNYSVQFNAANLPSGIYFYTLRAGNFTTTKKMILIK